MSLVGLVHCGMSWAGLVHSGLGGMSSKDGGFNGNGSFPINSGGVALGKIGSGSFIISSGGMVLGKIGGGLVTGVMVRGIESIGRKEKWGGIVTESHSSQ